MKKQLQATITTLFALSGVLAFQGANLAQNSPANSLATISQTNKNISPAVASANTYKCINYQGKPTTIVDTPRGTIKLIVWESNYFSSSGWTPEKRCKAVSARFQKFSDNKTLKYISTGIIDSKYKAICVSQPIPGRGYTCNQDGLLLTLQSNDNPNQILHDLFIHAGKIGGTAILRGQTVVSIDRILNRSTTISPSDEAIASENKTLSPQIQEVKYIEEKIETSDQSICSPPLCD